MFLKFSLVSLCKSPTAVSFYLGLIIMSVTFCGNLLQIEQPEAAHEERESRIFPDANSQNVFITCHSLSVDFLVYASDMGHLVYFHIEDWAVSNEYKHTVGINSVFGDSVGTRLVFCDSKSQAYVYDAVSYRK